MKKLRLFVDGKPGSLVTQAVNSRDAIRILEERYDWFYWFVRVFPSKLITFEEVG